MRALLQLLAKDMRLEWRTREVATTMALLTSLLVIVLAAIRPDPAAAPSAMWVTYAFASALGFTRTFAWERDDLTALRLAPVDPGAIYLAKVVVSWFALVAVELVSLPLFAALFTDAVWTRLGALALPLLLGGLALAAVGTLLGAILSQARLRDVLLPILMLPIALPAVIASVGATAGILDGLPVSAVGSQLQLLGAFDILVLTASLLLFDAIVEE
ncbi:MAG: heme exporter protein CcmB [Armatimonadota bacterium]